MFINKSDDFFVYTHLTDIDWDDKFYTSPNYIKKFVFVDLKPHTGIGMLFDVH